MTEKRTENKNYLAQSGETRLREDCKSGSFVGISQCIVQYSIQTEQFRWSSNVRCVILYADV